MTEQKAYLDLADVDRLIAAATNLRDQLIIRMLYYTGVRVTELISIEIADIDFTNRCISIRHLKERSRYKCFQCQALLGKSKQFCGSCGQTIEGRIIEKMQETRHRRIRVDDHTLAKIEEYLEKSNREDAPRLFKLSRQSIYYIIRDAAEATGLGGAILSIDGLKMKHHVSPHRFRDGFAVRFSKARSDLEGQRALQQHLGHKNFDTTAKYLKMTGERVSEIYDEVWGNVQ